ncbi:ionotropic receptor 75a-like [Musca autumnalis]|uniref:ionotropic receptor 75a-like n=1 Tax=Musca autumnalis TaxID=221902 RepID=UPI003CF267A5
MLYLHIINMILHNFVDLKLSCVVIFQCWPHEVLSHFSMAAANHQLYAQYANLDGPKALEDLTYAYLRYRRPKIGIFLDMNCNQSEKVITETSRIRFFNQHYHWLIYDERSDMSRFYRLFRNSNLSVDTDLTFIVPREDQEPDGAHFMAFDVYNNGWLQGGKLNISTNYELECRAGRCYKSKYITDLYKRSVGGNREALRDITMRVAVVVTKYDLNSPPEEINKFLLTQEDFHIDPLARLGYQVMILLLESLYTKVTYTYYDRWTDVEYTGGVVGALVNETADLTSSPFFMTTNRFRYLSALAATGDFRSVCMFRTPRNSGMHGGVFLEPFSTKVWLLFGCILLLAGVLLWLAFIMEHSEMKRYIRTYVPSLLTTCLISFGSACAQSSFLIPRSWGGRMAFISLSIITFIMYNYYTSVVVSSLLGSPVKSKIKNLRELADSDLDVGLEPLPFTHTYLNFSTLPDVKHFVRRKILSKKTADNLWYSASEGITKMRLKPGFVFVFETSSGYNLIERLYDAHEICDLNEILFRSDSMLATHLHRNSSYKEIVRTKIIRILESGVHSKHRRQWVRTHLNCFSNNFVINVGLEYTAPLFLMLLCGYGMVLFLVLLEVMWYRWEMRVQRSTGGN